MATKLTAQAGNIKDVLSGVGRDGNYQTVGEILDKEAVFFRDAPMVEANNVTYHDYTVRAALPGSSIVRGNKRRTASKGDVRMETAQLEERSIVYRVDVNDLKKSSNPSEFLNNEMRAGMQGIAQDFDTQMLYGTGIGEEMKGIAANTDTVDGTFVIDNGDSTGDLTSMYLVAWDAATGCSVAYPKGSSAGIKMEDKGIIGSWTDPVYAADGTLLDAGGFIEYATHEVSVSGGLVIKDDRARGRIANINVATPGKTIFDENNFILVMNQFPAHLRNKVKAYASRNLKACVDMRANDKDNAYYTPMTGVFGEHINGIAGVPIMLDEMISEDEDQIS
jgi:hypothetical protein